MVFGKRKSPSNSIIILDSPTPTRPTTSSLSPPSSPYQPLPKDDDSSSPTILHIKNSNRNNNKKYNPLASLQDSDRSVHFNPESVFSKDSFSSPPSQLLKSTKIESHTSATNEPLPNLAHNIDSSPHLVSLRADSAFQIQSVHPASYTILSSDDSQDGGRGVNPPQLSPSHVNELHYSQTPSGISALDNPCGYSSGIGGVVINVLDSGKKQNPNLCSIKGHTPTSRGYRSLLDLQPISPHSDTSIELSSPPQLSPLFKRPDTTKLYAEYGQNKNTFINSGDNYEIDEYNYIENKNERENRGQKVIIEENNHTANKTFFKINLDSQNEILQRPKPSCSKVIKNSKDTTNNINSSFRLDENADFFGFDHDLGRSLDHHLDCSHGDKLTIPKTPEFSLVKSVLQKHRDLFSDCSSTKTSRIKQISSRSIFASTPPELSIHSSPPRTDTQDFFSNYGLPVALNCDTKNVAPSFEKSCSPNLEADKMLNSQTTKPCQLSKKSESCPSNPEISLSTFSIIERTQKKSTKNPQKIQQPSITIAKQQERELSKQKRKEKKELESQRKQLLLKQKAIEKLNAKLNLKAELVKGLRVDIDRKVFEIEKKPKAGKKKKQKQNPNTNPNLDSDGGYSEVSEDDDVTINSLDNQELMLKYSKHVLSEQLKKSELDFNIVRNYHDGLITWQYTNHIIYDDQKAIFLPNSQPTTETIRSAMIVYSSEQFSDLVASSQDLISTNIKILYNSLNLQQLFLVVYGYQSFLKKSQTRIAQDFEASVRGIEPSSIGTRDKNPSIPPPHKSVGLKPATGSRKPAKAACSNDPSVSAGPNSSQNFSSDDSDSYYSSNLLQGIVNNARKLSMKNLSHSGVTSRIGSKKQAAATSSQIKDVVIQIEMEYPQTFFYMDINDLPALSRFISQVSVNIARLPLEKQNNNLNKSNSFSQGLNISSSAIKSGVGLSDTFKKMLEQIPKVTPLVAKSISREYPSIASLYAAWEKVANHESENNQNSSVQQSQNGKRAQLELQKEMLSSVMVNNGRGFGDRPIGSVISRLVFNFFNTLDPTEYVLESSKK